MITIAPDYDLFVKIIFVLWIVRGMFNLIGGLAGVKLKREKAGIGEILVGILILVLTIWILL